MAKASTGPVTDTAPTEPTDQVESFDGVEAGAAWLPPADGGKAAKLAVLGASDKATPDKDWEVSQIRAVLRGLSGGANVVGGKAVGANLQMTEAEADAIAEPLTNIINRNPMLRAMSKSSDVVTLALATLPYGMRVGGEAMETRRVRNEHIDIDAAPAGDA